jgi:hypothetical protein
MELHGEVVNLNSSKVENVRVVVITVSKLYSFETIFDPLVGV